MVFIPTVPETAERIAQWRADAVRYLRERLDERAPATLGEGMCFKSPLEGEGAIVLFPFELASGSGPPQSCCVAVGETEPNYYPAYGLSLAESFLLHIGTRFVLVMQIRPADAARAESFNVDDSVQTLVGLAAPGLTVEDARLEAAFKVDDAFHAVCRVHIRGEEDMYVFAGDCPPGFSIARDLPAPVAYRIHLGRILITEPDDREEERPPPS